jgi:RNA polymerase sigma-70 factor (ECF subfamily)
MSASTKYASHATRRAKCASTRDDLVEALARTANGDQAAYQVLYHATSAKLYGIIVRIVKRADLSEDVLQEVFIRVWLKAGTYDRGQGSPITWLAMIARNCALDVARPRQTSSLEDHPELMDLPADDDPAGDCERNDASRRLQACLRRLRPERREAVLLAFYNGSTREEIARQLGLSAATVKRWLRQSLDQLRSTLEELERPRPPERKPKRLPPWSTSITAGSAPLPAAAPAG